MIVRLQIGLLRNNKLTLIYLKQTIGEKTQFLMEIALIFILIITERFLQYFFLIFNFLKELCHGNSL